MTQADGLRSETRLLREHVHQVDNLPHDMFVTLIGLCWDTEAVKYTGILTAFEYCAFDFGASQVEAKQWLSIVCHRLAKLYAVKLSPRIFFKEKMRHPTNFLNLPKQDDWENFPGLKISLFGGQFQKCVCIQQVGEVARTFALNRRRAEQAAVFTL